MAEITREQLELAALAIGGTFSPGTEKVRTGETWDEWEWRGTVGICVGGVVICPHLDDGDAARLAALLCMTAEWGNIGVIVGDGGWVRVRNWSSRAIRHHDDTEPDKLRAWREAVVLCAAAVGERMKGGER